MPRPSADKEQYLRNGREEQRLINNRVKEAAVGQFIGLIQSKASDRENRVIELVACEPEATLTEILEVLSFHSGGPQSEPARNPRGTREGGRVTPTKRGESDSDSSTKPRPKQAASLASPAQSPKPFKHPRRKPRAERKAL